MQKHIKLTMLYLVITTPAFAVTTWTEENCTNKGGQIVTVGGTTFCKSTSSMNWWSAYSWCQAMGGYMPSIKELCPNADLIYAAPCGRSYGVNLWASTPMPENKVTAIGWQGTAISNQSVRTESLFAVCLPLALAGN